VVDVTCIAALPRAGSVAVMHDRGGEPLQHDRYSRSLSRSS